MIILLAVVAAIEAVGIVYLLYYIGEITPDPKLLAENASLRESVNQAFVVLQRKDALLKDLGNQNETLRASKPISAAEREDLERHLAEGRKAIASWSKIAEWLGEWKKDEISQGKHLGMTDAEVVIMYMSRGMR